MNTGHSKSTLAGDLLQQVVRVRVASPQTNDRLGKFLQFIDEQMDDWTRKDSIAYNLGGTRIRPDDFRVATFEIPSLSALSPGKDPRASDGAGPRASRIHGRDRLMRQRPVAEYIQSLVDNELSEICKIALAGAALWGDSHHVVGSLDWYADRNVDNHVLHKDTTGSTLFVALHYANDAPILGAEYIYDYWPMDSRGDVMAHSARHWWRANAPWREGAEAWPRELLHALELARESMDRPSGVPVVHCQAIEKNGLITFVDELIYHATPLEGHRSPEQRTKLYSRVSLGGKEHDLPMPALWRGDAGAGSPRNETFALTRAVSRDQMNQPVRENKKRRFARVWICVQPRSWTKPFDAY